MSPLPILLFCHGLGETAKQCHVCLVDTAQCSSAQVKLIIGPIDYFIILSSSGMLTLMNISSAVKINFGF